VKKLRQDDADDHGRVPAATQASAGGQSGEHATRRRAPRRTIRLRLTLLYGSIFLGSGAGLLAITYVLVSRSPFLVHGALENPLVMPGSLPAQQPLRRPSGLTFAQVAAVAREIQDRELAAHAADMDHLLLWSLVALGAMALVSLALGWAVAGRVLRPLRTITSAARDISAGSLQQRLSLGGPDDELKELGDTFDALLARLEASFDSQRRFIANASHELRTPLTITRTAVDVALGKRQPPPSPQVITLANRVSQGLDQVDRILESFLLLARAEHGAAQADPAEVCLADLARAAIADTADLASGKYLDLQYGNLAEAHVVGNRTLLSRMVSNVIENGIRHNQAGGWLRVSTELDGPVARLQVENGGHVLDQRLVDGLTQPFRRLGAERTGSGSGVGLGLSIVAAVATAHRGALRLRARPDGGLLAAVELPAVTRPAARAEMARAARAGVSA
jgi:signal transduction histidine kinase